MKGEPIPPRRTPSSISPVADLLRGRRMLLEPRGDRRHEGACTMTLTNEAYKYPGMGVKCRSCRT